MGLSTFKSSAELETTIRNLADVDSTLATVVDEVGFPDYPTRSDGFESIARIVVGQQISVKSASSIYDGLHRSLGRRAFTPRNFTELNSEVLGEVGLSKPKAKCLTGISQYLVEHPDFLSNLRSRSDSKVEESLTEFWGIGRSSAQTNNALAGHC